MKRTLFSFALVVGLGVLVVGCGTESNDSTNQQNAQSTAEQTSETTAESAAKPDTLPLLTIMVNLEKDMQSISSGLWRHNFDQIAQSAEGIANHAKIPKKQLKTIRGILGEKRFKAFVQDDKTVHNMAVKLSEAAAEENFKKSARLYQKLERGCISCHQKHRNTIRESSRW